MHGSVQECAGPLRFSHKTEFHPAHGSSFRNIEGGVPLYNRASLPGKSDTSAVVEAWLLLWSCRIALWCAPFPRVLGFARFCAGRQSSSGPLSADQAVRCIQRALRFTWRASCLTQALAGWIMLTRHGSSSRISIGVASPQQRAFSAHAWLEAGERVILGDTDLTPYHVIWTLPPE